jgi:hypothetical protein
MWARTFSKQRVTIVAMVVGALTLLAPPAQADSGDAFTRALENRESTPSFIGSPDAIDRALAAKEASKVAAIDARERALSERPRVGPSLGSDAFERALVTHANEIDSRTVSMLDRRERALGERPLAASPVAVSDGRFDWGDFGVGAGAGVGIVLLVGLGTVALRRNERMSTA